MLTGFDARNSIAINASVHKLILSAFEPAGTGYS